MKNKVCIIFFFCLFIFNKPSTSQSKNSLTFVTTVKGYLFSIDSCVLLFQQTLENEAFLDCIGQSAFFISNAQISGGLELLFQVGDSLEIVNISDNCLTKKPKSKLSYSFVEIELVVNLSNDGLYPFNTTKDYFLKFSDEFKLYECSQLDFNCTIRKVHFYNPKHKEQFLSKIGPYSRINEYFLY